MIIDASVVIETYDYTEDQIAMMLVEFMEEKGMYGFVSHKVLSRSPNDAVSDTTEAQ